MLLLILLLLDRMGVVDGFAKLPNGDESMSNTGNPGTLRRAVADWIAADGSSSSTVVTTYGPIEEWDVSNVTNMKNVFRGNGYSNSPDFKNFNADISKWNTSSVTNMVYTFSLAKAFNADISKWNTGSVTDMLSTFTAASDSMRIFQNGIRGLLKLWKKKKE